MNINELIRKTFVSEELNVINPNGIVSANRLNFRMYWKIEPKLVIVDFDVSSSVILNQLRGLKQRTMFLSARYHIQHTKNAIKILKPSLRCFHAFFVLNENLNHATLDFDDVNKQKLIITQCECL